MTILERAPTVKPEGKVGDTQSSALDPQSFIAHVSTLYVGPGTEGKSTVALCTEFSPDDVTGLTHVYVKGVHGLYTDPANAFGPRSPAASCIQRACGAFASHGIAESKFKQTVQEALDNSTLGHNPSHDLKRHFEDVLMSFVRVNLDKYVAIEKASKKDLEGVDASELYRIAMYPSDSKIFELEGPNPRADYTAQEYHGRPENVRMTQELRKTDWSGALQALQESKYTLREIASPVVRYGPRTAPGNPTFLAVTLTMKTDDINRDVTAQLDHCIGQSTRFGFGEGWQALPVTELSTVITDTWSTMLSDNIDQSSVEGCVQEAILGDQRDPTQVSRLSQAEVIQSLLHTLSDAIKQRVSEHRLARDFRVVYYPKRTFDSLAASSGSNLECAYTDPLFQGVGEKRPI